MALPTARTLYLQPGVLYVPAEPSRLCAVVASGVAVTIFDKARGFGGMGHYTHPRRRAGDSTPIYAAPALVGLVDLFQKAGSSVGDLETSIYGGAENIQAPGFEPGRSLLNIQMGVEILEKLGMRVASSDLGGRFARKLAFHTATGEGIVAKVEAIRAVDWYPQPMGGVFR